MKITPIPDRAGYGVSRNGGVFSSKSGQWVPLSLSLKKRTGYLRVSLRERGKVRTIDVHRLVLETFSGPCRRGMEARHLDGKSTNNRASNLEWATHSQNELDKLSHGTHIRGERHPRHNAKISKADAREIRRRFALGIDSRKLASRFGLSRSTIYAIASRKSWAWLTEESCDTRSEA